MPDTNVIVALLGVSVLILAVRGSLKHAWLDLLGGASPTDPGTAHITPTGQTLCHFSATNTDTCVQSPEQCRQFGGDPSRPDTLGYCAPGGAGRAPSGPGPGAPGSGVTTQ